MKNSSSDFLAIVAEFHQTFKHPILESPMIPDQKRIDLRLALLKEELNELQDAIEKKNIVLIADAFCDIQYVLTGAILEFGFKAKFLALFLETHRSNMSKACQSLEEAEATVEFYKSQGVDSYFKHDGNGWLVYRSTDNKTLKSINYSPSDLKSIL